MSKVSRNANRQKYLACGFRPPVGQLQTDVREEAFATETSAILSPAELERVVTDLFTGALGAPSIGQDESFFESGGDSLGFVSLLLALENRLGCSLPVEALAEHPTIAGMVEALQRTSAPLRSIPPAYYERLDPFPVIKQVLTTANLSVAEKWSRLRELLRIRLTDTGPRLFGYTLPYALGARIIEAMCRRTGIMRRLFRKRARLIRQGLAMSGRLVGETETFRQHLRTHLWMHWRLAALARCSRAEFDRWVTVHGVENLQRALHRGGGVVLPLSHLGPYHFSMLLLRHLGVDNFMVVGAQPPIGAVLDFLGFGRLKDRHLFSISHREHRRASQLLKGQQLLQQGGVVLISGDGYQGKLPFLFPFCGRERRFGMGFAELAVRTGACVVPIFYRVTPEGGLTVEFSAPLVATGAHDEQVAQFVRQYVTLLEQRWLADLGSVRFYQLEWFLDPSMAARSNALFTEKSGYSEHAFVEEV
jgi:lauroyl/myristoyl acyltransferase/acyl carrier protein